MPPTMAGPSSRSRMTGEEPCPFPSLLCSWGGGRGWGRRFAAPLTLMEVSYQTGTLTKGRPPSPHFEKSGGTLAITADRGLLCLPGCFQRSCAHRTPSQGMVQAQGPLVCSEKLMELPQVAPGLLQAAHRPLSGAQMTETQGH